MLDHMDEPKNAPRLHAEQAICVIFCHKVVSYYMIKVVKNSILV
jgi:hypothetical protein